MTIDQRNGAGRMWGVMGLGLAAIAFLGYSWLGTPWHQAVSLPLPYRRMEIPVLWWAVYLSFAISARYLLSCERRTYRLLLLDGLLLHLQWLLVSFYIAAPFAGLVGRAYRLYIACVVIGVVIGTAFWAGRGARMIWEELRKGRGWAVIHLPLCMGTALVIIYAAWHGRWFMAGSAMAGCLGGWLTTHRPIRRWRASRAVEWGSVGLLVLIAFGLRLAWYLHLVSLVGFDYHTGFPAASDDGQSYHSAASNIAADPLVLFSRSNPVVSSSFDPLYPLLLGLWYRLTGVHFLPAVILQSLLGALMGPLIYLLGKTLGGGSRASGLWAAGLMTVSQPLIFSSAVYGIEALYVPALTVWIWLAVRYAKHTRRVSTIVWMGVCGGLILGLRRYAPLLLVGILPWMVWVRGRQQIRSSMINWLSVVVVACVVYVPIEAMYLRCGQGRLLSRGGSMYWEMPAQFPELAPDNRQLIQLGIDPFRDISGSIRNVVRQPVAVAKVLWDILPRRSCAFFFWAPFGYFDTVLLLNPTIQNPFTPVAEFYFTLFVLLGMIWTVREPHSRAVALLLMLITGIHVFVHSVLFITHSIRYSIPIRPYLMAFGAAGLVLLYRASAGGGFFEHDFGGHPSLQQPSGR